MKTIPTVTDEEVKAAFYRLASEQMTDEELRELSDGWRYLISVYATLPPEWIAPGMAHLEVLTKSGDPEAAARAFHQALAG